MRAATHGCNEGSIEAGWLGQSHLPVMLNYVPTTTAFSEYCLWGKALSLVFALAAVLYWQKTQSLLEREHGAQAT